MDAAMYQQWRDSMVKRARWAALVAARLQPVEPQPDTAIAPPVKPTPSVKLPDWKVRSRRK